MRPPRGRIPPARRRRTVTEEEASLWRRFVAAAGIAPLRPEADPRPQQPPPEPGKEPDGTAASRLPHERERNRVRATPPPPDLAIGVAPGGLDRKRWDELRRGRTRPQRTLDLHGRRADEALEAVRRFVLGAQAEGLRCVAIVTGKGSGETGGVLRRELPHWLNAPPLRGVILAVAHPHRANTGAVHLLLRRKRGLSGRG